MVNITDLLFWRSMFMKVIILTDYGNNSLPKEFKADYNNKLWRMDEELIGRIENLDWTFVEDEYCGTLSPMKNYSTPIEKGIKYFYGTPNGMNLFITFEIIDVDTSRPWCIEEYDGAEDIKYLDGYKCVDRESNYFEFKS